MTNIMRNREDAPGFLQASDILAYIAQYTKVTSFTTTY